MEVKEDVKKILALLALIDDTQEQIKRIKTFFDDQIRTIKSEAITQTTTLQATLDEQYAMLTQLTSNQEEDRMNGVLDEVFGERQRGRTNPSLRKPINRIKEQALLYIGRLMAYPVEVGEKDNGQVLPSTD